MAKPLIYYPKLWNPVLEPVRAATENLAQWQKRDEKKSGLGNAKSVREDIKKADIERRPAVFVLPVTHAAIHLNDLEIKVLGPCTATRDDIYVIRRKSRPKKLVVGPEQYYRIGVIDADITTTYALRVAIREWDPDPIFFSHRLKLVHEETQKKFTKHILDGWDKSGVDKLYEFVSVSSMSKRLKSLISDEIEQGDRLDAAIFTGYELSCRNIAVDGEIKKINPLDHPDLIDVMNLNRVMSNVFHARYFPRTVFVITRRHFDEYQDGIRSFFRKYNDLVSDSATSRSRNSAPGKRHRLCGALCNPDVESLKAIIRFTHKVFSNEVKHMRGSDCADKEGMELLPLCRGIRVSDIQDHDSQFGPEWNRKLVDSIEFHLKNVGHLNLSRGELEDLSSAMHSEKQRVLTGTGGRGSEGRLLSDIRSRVDNHAIEEICNKASEMLNDDIIDGGIKE